MNIHHLELFYFVAKHGGIAGAVRGIPYGIQQPAVSAQMARLEEGLGVKLFNRRPFSLSPAGEELFRFVEPFFGNVESVEKRIRGSESPQLRIAAPALVLHDYVPDLLQRVRAKFPNFRLNLHEAGQPDAERMLQAREIDLAISVVEKKPRAGFHSQSLIELPLVLLVPTTHWLNEVQDLWGKDRIEETLIAFPPGEVMCLQFQKGLRALGVEWFPGIEATSSRLIERYVGNGFGIGLTAEAPGTEPQPGVRRIPIPEFPRLTVAAVWEGRLTPIARQFLDEAEAQAKVIGGH